MTLYCTSEHCRIHKLCDRFKSNDGKDNTVFTDHHVNMTKQSKGCFCPFFGLKKGYLTQDLNKVHSPNTFETITNNFVIPRGIKL
jgi:hypothetical protein